MEFLLFLILIAILWPNFARGALVTGIGLLMVLAVVLVRA